MPMVAQRGSRLRSRGSHKAKRQKPHLVQDIAEQLREKILACESETRLGSLQDIAQLLGVGIVTVQQAARVLEHEGLLRVRRGPGGGYYGTRPDEAALERSLTAFMRVHGFGYREALELISLLDCEILPTAARCPDATLHEAMRALHERIDHCETAEQRIALEADLRNLLFRMVSLPLIEFLVRATDWLYKPPSGAAVFPGSEGVAEWKTSKHRLLRAVLDRDEGLARFEAERYRQQILARLHRNETSSR